MKKRKSSQILAIGLGIMLLVLCAGYMLIDHFTKNIERMEVRRLNGVAHTIDDILFEKNIYLMPDTAYFAKLEPLLLGKQIHSEYETFINMIQKNLSKGVLYHSSIHSVYAMLEDEKAPYLLVNGIVRGKEDMLDTDWQDTCESMGESCYLNWREINSSFLNTEELLTVYRAYESESYMEERTVGGYIVINYYRSHILNEINSSIGLGEQVILYNPMEDTFLYSGEIDIPEALIREVAVSSGIEGGGSPDSGVITTQARNKLIYSVFDSKYAKLSYILIKEDMETSRLLSEISSLFLVIIFVICIGVIAFMLLYYRQYHQYLTGLAQIITATDEDVSGEEEMMRRLAEGFSSREEDLIIIARKILEDSVDMNELKKVLHSEQQLRVEVEMLYGRAQINSHFLLNTLDSIYWESVKNNGGESEATRMMERLCVILKYALDSSNPYICLEDEVQCAEGYLMIQKMRKRMRIETVWEIQDGLGNAKVGKLMLQPILENSIQHGGFRPDEIIRFFIEVREVEGTLYLCVSDNGAGMDEAEMRRMNQMFRENIPVRSNHIGLLNVNRRIQLQYGEEYGIVLQPAKYGRGLMVVIRLKCMF